MQYLWRYVAERRRPCAGRENRYEVAFFNPVSNIVKRSVVRLVNPDDADAEVTISAVDDDGDAAPEGDVTLTVAAGEVLDQERAGAHPNARVMHGWNATLGACEIDLAGILLAGALGLSPQAGADDVSSHMLRRKGIRSVLCALREIGIGDVHDSVVTLSCYEEELRYRGTLETLRLETVDYEGWEAAEVQFRALEALARRLQDLGL